MLHIKQAIVICTDLLRWHDFLFFFVNKKRKSTNCYLRSAYQNMHEFFKVLKINFHVFKYFFYSKYWKRTKKTYSPIDNDKRKDKKQPRVLTIKCLRQVNKNKLTQKTDREVRRRNQWRRGSTVLGRGNCIWMKDDVKLEWRHLNNIVNIFFIFFYKTWSECYTWGIHRKDPDRTSCLEKCNYWINVQQLTDTSLTFSTARIPLPCGVMGPATFKQKILKIS